jgi:hypothetical protein
VNGQHLRAFLWLRWRLRANQLKRGGTANAVLFALLSIGAVLLAIGLFVIFFLVGLLPLRHASPQAVLFVWDGLVAAFLFFWGLGLMAELQRTEALSLEKFLHLPVSLSGAFLVNYLSSLFSVNLLLFVPAMLGLALGQLLARGPALLVVFPLLAALVLMITALTYQFQGWLAALMSNKRRRRTVIVLVTAGFVLLCQLPNLLNVLHPWRPDHRQDALAQKLDRETAELDRSLKAGKITPAEYGQKWVQAQAEYRAGVKEREQRTWQEAAEAAQVVNLVLPPGWLPLGAMGAAEGDVRLALLGTLGLALIGGVSLWRSYRTTVRLYTGQLGVRKRPARAAAPAAAPAPGGVRLVEWRLPWVSEQAAAVALAGFRGLLRAPEVKMLLLTPLILVLVFGSMLFTRSLDLPREARPVVAFGGMAMVLLSMGQLVGNQFGFDRAGFRVFVLCPARRRDILLGKNLAFAPLALGLGVVAVVLVEVLYPLRPDHLLATVPQFVAMYVVFCLLANWLALFAPMPIAAGSLKPSNPSVIPMLLHLLFVAVLPVALAPMLLPLGLEAVLGELDYLPGVPVHLILSVLECVVLLLLYRLALGWQGSLLQSREQHILKIVTARAE